jgi:hypothetical protein
MFSAAQLQRLITFQSAGELTETEVGELLNDAPPAADWSDEVCRHLTAVSTTAIRQAAVAEYARRRPTEAAPVLFEMVQAGSLADEEFVLYLAPEKYAALDWLGRQPATSLSRRLMKLLDGAAILVQPGMWLECSVGNGRITRIEDPQTGTSRDQFFEDEGEYVLHVMLHVELDYELRGEAASLDMQTRQIRIPRARGLFICPQCGLATARLAFYRSHLAYAACGGPFDLAPQANRPLPLDHLRFFNRRTPRDRD